jgi:hypothetical protein
MQSGSPEADKGNTQHREATLAIARGFAEKPQQAQPCQNSEGQVDIEHPALAVVFGEVAAKRRS